MEEEEGYPVEGRDGETQNNCSNGTKTDDQGVVDTEDLNKAGLLGGEAVQENRDEADEEESGEQADTETDDKSVENISAT